MEDVRQQVPKRTNPVLWIVLVVIVILAVAGFIYYWQSSNSGSNTNSADTNTVAAQNINSQANTNTRTNANTNALANTNGAPTNTNALSNNNTSNVNSNTNSESLIAYADPDYKFSVQYPADFSVNVSKLSNEARSQRGDGLVADIGFRPSGLQGPLFLVRVFNRSLQGIVDASSEFGNLSSQTSTIGGKSAKKFSQGTNRFGLEGDSFTYIVETANYRDTSDLEIYDLIKSSFSLQ